jgi:hypothetical protein
MKYGAIVKAFYNFSKKYQNYGKFVFDNWNCATQKFIFTSTSYLCCIQKEYLSLRVVTVTVALCEKIVCKRMYSAIFSISVV